MAEKEAEEEQGKENIQDIVETLSPIEKKIIPYLKERL